MSRDRQKREAPERGLFLEHEALVELLWRLQQEDSRAVEEARVELLVVLADSLYDSQGGFFEEALFAVRSAWAEFHDGNV